MPAASRSCTGVAVLVPVKAFTAAKGRLAPVFPPAWRAALARHMAAIVVRAADGLPVYVVCDDHAVAEWAQQAGAEVLWRPGRGLNQAVHDGVDALGEAGFARVVIAHSDLPLATSLRWVGSFPGVTLVPDRRDDGTNAIAVPTGAGFEFAYGAASFRQHLAEARRLSLSVRVVRHRALGFDVDLPGDLHAATQRSAALRTFVDDLERHGTHDGHVAHDELTERPLGTEQGDR